MRALINLIENALRESAIVGLSSITTQQVIAYARDPKNTDVHSVYEEQIDFAFDGNRDSLDRWITEMTEDVKSKVAEMVKEHRTMYRGFSGPVREPLGVHWTVSPEMAKEFGTHSIVEAYIDPNTIDWLGTVTRGIFWDNSAEDELYLIRGSEIKLVDGRISRA